MAHSEITNEGGEHGAHSQAHGTGRYWLIWCVLIAGTLLTVATGRMDLGAANIYLAMAIATTKATLVVLFFMHLYDTGGVNRLVFVVSVLFLLVLMAGVFGDIMTRLPVSLPNGGPLAPVEIHESAMHGSPAHE